jgi:SAM-dependent methyltransferase
MRSSSTEWDELGAREPYFAVLTDERFLRGRIDLKEFYATGEADVERLLDGLHPQSALDFGCGVGRLTRALARRVPDVVGVDAAPSMLRLAAEAVPSATFLSEIPERRFDFVCSLIVFQHIPLREGYRLVDQLLGIVADGGTAALHFTFRRPGGALRRLARRIRARVPLVHRIAARLEGDRRGLPYMQMNEYDRDAILARFSAAGFGEPKLVPTDHGGIEGAIVMARRGTG